MRHHCCELIAEKATILVATSTANDWLENFMHEIAGHVIATTRVHAKLDEQCAELHGVLPADFMVDVQGADKAQRQLVCPPQVEELDVRLRPAGRHGTKVILQPHRVVLVLRQKPHSRGADQGQVPAVVASDDRGSLAQVFCQGLAARASPDECLANHHLPDFLWPPALTFTRSPGYVPPGCGKRCED
eukprot:scaffold17553_cov31-Phaeocystis_antarctica.AAC.1